jgi:hypothetical protein
MWAMIQLAMELLELEKSVWALGQAQSCLQQMRWHLNSYNCRIPTKSILGLRVKERLSRKQIRILHKQISYNDGASKNTLTAVAFVAEEIAGCILRHIT